MNLGYDSVIYVKFIDGLFTFVFFCFVRLSTRQKIWQGMVIRVDPERNQVMPLMSCTPSMLRICRVTWKLYITGLYYILERKESHSCWHYGQQSCDKIPNPQDYARRKFMCQWWLILFKVSGLFGDLCWCNSKLGVDRIFLVWIEIMSGVCMWVRD